MYLQQQNHRSSITRTELDLDVTQFKWLGYLDLTNQPLEIGTPIRIKPLAYCEGEQWILLSPNERQRLFPDEGTIALFRDHVFQGAACVIELGVTEAMERPGPYMHYRIDGSWRTRQSDLRLAKKIAYLVDCTHLTLNDVRHKLREGTLFTSTSPAWCNARIMIQARDGVVGPIQFNSTGNQPYAYETNNRLKVYIYSASNVQDALLHIDDLSLTLVDETRLPESDYLEDWSLPKRIIQEALRLLREHRPELNATFELTKRHIAELSEAVAEITDSCLPDTLLEAQRLLRTAETYAHDLAQFDADIEHTPALERVREKARAEIKAQMAAYIAAAQEKVQRLATQAECQRQECERLADEIERLRHARAEAEAQLHSQTTAEQAIATVAQHVDEHMRHFSQTLAESVVARWFAPEGTLPSSKLPTIPFTDITPAPGANTTPGGNLLFVPTDEWCEHKAEPLDLEQIKTKYRPLMDRSGSDLYTVRGILGSLLGGVVPVVEGIEAETMFSLLARLLVAGNVLTVPIPIGALSPLDLLGQIDPATHLFVPAAHALADMLVTAQMHPEQPALVILDGMDRVDYATVIQPIFRAYAARFDTSPATMPLWRARPDDPFAPISRLQWPQNVMLGAITYGNRSHATLSLPEDCWHFAVRIPWKSKSIVSQSATEIPPGIVSSSALVDIASRYAQGERFAKEVLNAMSGETLSKEIQLLFAPFSRIAATLNALEPAKEYAIHKTLKRILTAFQGKEIEDDDD